MRKHTVKTESQTTTLVLSHKLSRLSREKKIKKLEKAIESKSGLILCGLTLSYNRFSELPSVISQLTNLEIFFLSHNLLTKFPSGLNKLTNLEALYLNKNFLTKSGYLPHTLKALDLKNNKLTKLSSRLCNLTNLTQINIGKNNISHISRELTKLTALTELKANKNNLTNFPSMICKFKNLKRLDLSQNCIFNIPPTINQLPNLLSLKLSKNKLLALPRELADCTNLTTLNVQYNKITKIPLVIITSLTSLQDLRIGYRNNFFTTHKKIDTVNIFTLKEIAAREIHLHLNQKYHNITEIDLFKKNKNLDSNNLSVLLKDLAKNSPKLEKLSLKNEAISVIPKEITLFTNLKELDFSNNSLTALCNELFNLTSLEHLSLANNKITDFPNKFSKLTNLRSLYINQELPCVSKISIACLALFNLTVLLTDISQKHRLCNHIAENWNLIENMGYNQQQISSIHYWWNCMHQNGRSAENRPWGTECATRRHLAN